MRDIAERLDALNGRLTALLDERRALQYRWTLAATKANHWPDMRRAVDLFVSIQPAADRPDIITAVRRESERSAR
jgi:hypothetical protein